jgi:hypothetical protein
MVGRGTPCVSIRVAWAMETQKCVRPSLPGLSASGCHKDPVCAFEPFMTNRCVWRALRHWGLNHLPLRFCVMQCMNEDEPVHGVAGWTSVMSVTEQPN